MPPLYRSSMPLSTALVCTFVSFLHAPLYSPCMPLNAALVRPCVQPLYGGVALPSPSCTSCVPVYPLQYDIKQMLKAFVDLQQEYAGKVCASVLHGSCCGGIIGLCH